MDADDTAGRDDDGRFAAEVCAALRQQAARAGVELGDEPDCADACWHDTTDPYSGEVSRIARFGRGNRRGQITLFADGRVFAEYDLLLPHPSLADHYIESVQCWGNRERLRGDVVVAEFAR